MTEIGKIVSNADVAELIRKQKEFYTQRPAEYNAERRKNDNLRKEQSAREEVVISEKPPCSISAIKSLGINMADLKSGKLTKIVSEQFYDPIIMKAVACVSEAIFYSGNSDDTIQYNERIKDWLRDLKQIGDDSVEGMAMRASIKGAPTNVMSSNIFIIKAPQDPNNTDLIHELFVGIQLNKLRSKLPNFSYVFGGFKCSPPNIDKETKQVVAWCENTANAVSYVAYENVQPSASMKDYVKTCTFRQFCNRLLQVCYAIDLAYRTCDFTHYDLHNGNVLNRIIQNENGEGNKQFYIPYYTDEDKTEYLLTDGIATIIDYGICHVKVDGVSYGDFIRQDFNVYPDRSFPIGDLYKFLLFCMLDMLYAKNTECFNHTRNILTFFNDFEPAENILAQQNVAYYYMPYNDKTKGISVMDFAKYIRIVMDEKGIESDIHERPRDDIMILGCGDEFSKKICYTNVGIIEEIGVRKFDFRVQDVMDFVSSYQNIQRSDMAEESKGEGLQKLIDNFDYDKHVSEGITKLREYLITVHAIADGIKVMDISQMNLTSLLSDVNIAVAYRRYITDMLSLYDLFERRDTLYDVLKFIMVLYSDDTNTILLDNIYADFDPYVMFFNTYSKIIYNESQRIQNEVKQNANMFNKAVESNKTFDFWKHGLQFFDRTISKEKIVSN